MPALKTRRVALPLVCLLLALAACAPEPGFGECEPGVADLARTADVAPACP